MDAAGTLPESISIVPPAQAGEKLLFRAFDNAAPIGYARLKKLQPRRNPSAAIDMFDPAGFDAYELKMIEVAQNYRHKGVGSTLLKAIVHYCHDRNIQRLTGEIKGDTRTLRQWYRSNGFVVDSRDRIELLPTSRC